MLCCYLEISKYIIPPLTKTTYLTPSPVDIAMESPSSMNCMNICNNNLFVRQVPIAIDTVDTFTKTNLNTPKKHPGQAVKIVMDNTGEHKIIKKEEVCREEKTLKNSKSYSSFNAIETRHSLKRTNSSANLKECKSCDENLIKFIFTKHGIEVISDVETIV